MIVGLHFIVIMTFLYGDDDDCGFTTTHWSIYYIKLKSRLSVRLSALFWRSVSRPWLHGSTSDLLDVIAMSSDMTKFILKSFKKL